jgi:hypothetical protein
MVKFSKIAALAGTAFVFAGLSYGQVNCNAPVGPTANAFLVRAEGTTEQTADITLTCTNTSGAATVASTANIQVFISIPVTSKVLATTGANAGLTEALAISGGVVNQQGLIGGGGTSLIFNGVTIPATGIGASFTIVLTNIRVNASTLAVGTGAPPAITASIFMSGPGVVASASNPVQVAFAQSGIAPTKSFKTTGGAPVYTAATSGTNAFVICNAINPVAGPTAGVLNVVQVAENFASAFKAQGSAASNGAVGSEFTNNTETGFVPAAWPQTAGASNIANSATRIKVVFNNVPANLNIWVPVVVTSGTMATIGGVATAVGGTFTLTTSESGAFTAATASTASGTNIAGLSQVAISGGTGQAVYEYTPVGAPALPSLSSAYTETFNFPVYGIGTANSIAASSTAITESVSFAPVGSTNIPNFVIGPSTTSLTSATFNRCTTSLLFPFVTNQLGFDTGIAIANTSTDPFGALGATAQAGTCSLNFYGNGAPSPANVTTPNVPTGTVYTQVLSGVAAGFQLSQRQRPRFGSFKNDFCWSA